MLVSSAPGGLLLDDIFARYLLQAHNDSAAAETAAAVS